MPKLHREYVHMYDSVLVFVYMCDVQAMFWTQRALVSDCHDNLVGTFLVV